MIVVIISLIFQGVFITYDDDKIYTYIYLRETINGTPDIVKLPTVDENAPPELSTESKRVAGSFASVATHKLYHAS